VIPKGNYGAGSVMLWDRGRYTVAEGTPEKAYRTGKIHLALMGEKLVGEWTLVRLRNRGSETKTNWLIIRNAGPRHTPRMTGVKRDVSVITGRTQDEIADETKKRPAGTKARTTRRSKGAAAPKKKAPRRRAPSG
jgi:bifunctional non-homologous end joining protein LigD